MHNSLILLNADWSRTVDGLILLGTLFGIVIMIQHLRGSKECSITEAPPQK